MIALLCEHYGWTPDYVLKKVSFQQAFVWYDKAIEQKMIANGQKPLRRKLKRSEHEKLAKKIVNEVDEFKRKKGIK